MGINWGADWISLDFPKIVFPLSAGLAAARNLDGRLEAFSFSPADGNLVHTWQTTPGGGWN